MFVAVNRDPGLFGRRDRLRLLTTVLQDNAGEVLDVDDHRAALFTFPRAMAATYTDQPATPPTKELFGPS